MVEEPTIKKEHLPEYIRNHRETHENLSQIKISNNVMNLKDEVIEIEKARIIDTLKKNNMVLRKAARQLGITERQIGYKIKKYRITIRNTG